MIPSVFGWPVRQHGRSLSFSAGVKYLARQPFVERPDRDLMAEAAKDISTGKAPPTVRPLSDPETPSGKGSGDENFPVGSILLPARLRPHVAAFYAFARAADDVADNGALSPEDKVARLDAMDAALTGQPGFDGPGYAKAHRLRSALQETGVTDKHARDLLVAFRQDALKPRYADWQELIHYCEVSANPVGRFLLDLHGEDRSGYPASDALCTVLQILNHLQDCGDDLRNIDRVYIPADWMREEGSGVEDLRLEALTPGLRAVLTRMLDSVDAMLVEAKRLPLLLRDRRLAMESATIVRLATRLSARLRHGDPLADRVALSKSDFALSTIAGIAEGLFGVKASQR